MLKTFIDLSFQSDKLEVIMRAINTISKSRSRQQAAPIISPPGLGSFC